MKSIRAWRAGTVLGALFAVVGLLLAAALPAVSARAAEPVPGRPPAPDLAGGTKWLNSNPLSIRDLRGKVVLVDFWEYTCVNCLRSMPHLKEWRRRYKD